MMRITNLWTRERRLGEMLRGQERLEAARERVSSGRRIQDPSDAPNDIAELLRVRAQVAELSRRQDGIDATLPGMKATEAALGDLSAALREVRTLTLQARNGTASAEQHGVLADQVGRIADRARDLANTRVNGRYLFAGTATDGEPFSAGPPVTYAGNDRSLTLSVLEGTLFATNVSGETLRNTRDGTDLFGNLEQLEAVIRAGDADGMGAALTALDADLEHVVRQRADMGARLQYVQLARERIGDGVLAARERQSQLEDVDLAAAVLEYSTAENAHEATLAVAGRIGRPSLLDYLG